MQACGQRCELDIAKSDQTKAVCTLPEIRTTYSVINFGIAFDSETIHDGTWTGSAPAEQIAKLIDGDPLDDFVSDDPDPLDNSVEADDCYFQIQYGEDVLGYMDRFEFYINKPEQDRSIYEDQMLQL